MVTHDKYFDFLMSVLSETMNSQGNPKVVYSLLQENLDKLDDNFAQWLQNWAIPTLTEIAQNQALRIAKDIATFSTLLQNFQLGNVATNIEIAIVGHKAAVFVFTRDAFPKDWAAIQNNLGMAYSDRIVRDKGDNLEQSIQYFKNALLEYTCKDNPQEWVITLNNLGTAHYDRIKEKKEENLEQAIHYFKQALECSHGIFAQKRAMIQNNLGNIYLYRLREDKKENLEQAINCFKQALLEYTRENFPQEWATTKNNLGVAYRNRLCGNKEENVEQAIIYFEQALLEHTYEGSPIKWATTENNLGTAYLNRPCGNKKENIEHAILCFQWALQVRTSETSPQHYVETQFNLGIAYQVYQKNQKWQLAAYNSFKNAIATVEFIRAEIISGEEGKQKLAEEWNKLYQSMVEVCLTLNNPTEAIEYVERSKARNLAELIASRDLYSTRTMPENVRSELQRLRQAIEIEKRRLAVNIKPNYTYINQLRQQYNELNPFPHISLNQIQTLIEEDSTILEWYIASDTFLTFVITCHNRHPIIVWQSSPNDRETLINWVDEYMNVYYTDKKTWQSELNNRISGLSEILHLDEIFSLVHQACEQCSHVILVPHVFLHFLPLHALRLADGECLLDKFESVRYAPSCQLLQQVQQQQHPNFSDLFSIQNPRDDLPYADLEVEVIRSFFSTDNVLTKQAATKTALDDNKKLSIAHCTHFACHGNFNFESPLESALKLANDEQLTLKDIFGLSLNQCRLVTLSACETGLTDPTSISDEYIGLPSGFLYAGCTNVVSSLWTVNQVSTTFLMIKFYKNLKDNQISVAKALNDAQRWLQDATLQKLLDWITQLNLNEDVMKQIKDEKDELEEWYNHDEKPYNDPYHWAAFCAIGQ
jgi:CHAT domain-containing protein